MEFKTEETCYCQYPSVCKRKVRDFVFFSIDFHLEIEKLMDFDDELGYFCLLISHEISVPLNILSSFIHASGRLIGNCVSFFFFVFFFPFSFGFCYMIPSWIFDFVSQSSRVIIIDRMTRKGKMIVIRNEEEQKSANCQIRQSSAKAQKSDMRKRCRRWIRSRKRSDTSLPYGIEHSLVVNQKHFVLTYTTDVLMI